MLDTSTAPQLDDVLDTQLARIELARALGKARLAEAFEQALRAVDAQLTRTHGFSARARAASVLSCERDELLAHVIRESFEATRRDLDTQWLLGRVMRRAPEELFVWLIAKAASRFPARKQLSPVVGRMVLYTSILQFVQRYRTRAGLGAGGASDVMTKAAVGER